MFITPEDIADHIYWCKRHWFHGKPQISLEGNLGSFCKLQFDFGDKKVTYRVYVKDAEKRRYILNSANEAIEKFSDFDVTTGQFLDVDEFFFELNPSATKNWIVNN